MENTENVMLKVLQENTENHFLKTGKSAAAKGNAVDKKCNLKFPDSLFLLFSEPEGPA